MTDSDETPIAGATEYSFGMWTRFRFNSAEGKVLQKPDWMGVARATTNKLFPDQQKLGDRTLS